MGITRNTTPNESILFKLFALATLPFKGTDFDRHIFRCTSFFCQFEKKRNYNLIAYLFHFAFLKRKKILLTALEMPSAVVSSCKVFSGKSTSASTGSEVALLTEGLSILVKDSDLIIELLSLLPRDDPSVPDKSFLASDIASPVANLKLVADKSFLMELLDLWTLVEAGRGGSRIPPLVEEEEELVGGVSAFALALAGFGVTLLGGMSMERCGLFP